MLGYILVGYFISGLICSIIFGVVLSCNDEQYINKNSDIDSMIILVFIMMIFLWPVYVYSLMDN